MHAFSVRKLDWIAASRPRALERDELQLWLIAIDELESGSAGRCCLSEAEALRASRIADPQKRRLYTGGRLGLRMLLEGYTGIPCAEIRLEYGARGKPGLPAGQGPLKFNYSVSASYALYAFSPVREVGVDLEIQPRTINWKGLSGRILSDRELPAWHRIPQALRNESMMACWTRKEAFGKLLGVGIRYHMNQASLFLDPDRHTWRSPVAGLFDAPRGSQEDSVYGIQIGLPVAGAAALMYATPHPCPAPGRVRDTAPVLSAFRYAAG